MKVLSLVLFLCLLDSTWAQGLQQFEELEEAQLYSIEEDEYALNYVEASEEALPWDYYQSLERSFLMRFTPISLSRANSLFNSLKRDSRARQRNPNGWCTRRRIYIKNYLRRRGIYSGRLYINCPGNRGRLRLRDQVSGRYYTFINFHDTNVVLAKTSSGNYYRVMDPQYQSGPRTLGNYLAQIERYQRLRRAKTLDDAGICYWRISSPALVEDFEGEFTPR